MKKEKDNDRGIAVSSEWDEFKFVSLVQPSLVNFASRLHCGRKGVIIEGDIEGRREDETGTCAKVLHRPED